MQILIFFLPIFLRLLNLYFKILYHRRWLTTPFLQSFELKFELIYFYLILFLLLLKCFHLLMGQYKLFVGNLKRFLFNLKNLRLIIFFKIPCRLICFYKIKLLIINRVIWIYGSKLLCKIWVIYTAFSCQRVMVVHYLKYNFDKPRKIRCVLCYNYAVASRLLCCSYAVIVGFLCCNYAVIPSLL